MNALVSCVMPTYNRRDFIPAAIDCFLKQTYEKRELIILDDGNDKVRDLIPIDSRIIYFDLPTKLTTGCKRNMINATARGEIIAHFDDDDWSADDRLADQVQLLRNSKMPIAGYSDMIYWNVSDKSVVYYKGFILGYVAGNSLCYLRDYWIQHQFPMLQVASDGVFILQSLGKIAASKCDSRMVARIHTNNVSDKSSLKTKVDIALIPKAFWDSERLRTGQ
jgi:glycosyltransferase involved in cell wall biosynthesis